MKLTADHENKLREHEIRELCSAVCLTTGLTLPAPMRVLGGDEDSIYFPLEMMSYKDNLTDVLNLHKPTPHAGPFQTEFFFRSHFSTELKFNVFQWNEFWLVCSVATLVSLKQTR